MMKPQNFIETLVWYYIVGNYVVYFTGGQYVFGPLLGCYFAYCVLKKWWNQTDDTPPEEKVRVPIANWIWIVSMLVMEVALIGGHLTFNLGTGQIIKSSLNGWLRRWALLALFPLAGNLDIRPELIYRAICIFCFQNLVLLPILYGATMVGIPGSLYNSPLKAFGGGDFYDVTFYTFDQIDGGYRMFLFTPWAPALALVSNVYFFLAYQEKDKKWRLLGMAGAVAMSLSSVSRLGLICLPFVSLAMWGLTNFLRPWVQFTSGFASVFLGMFAPTIIQTLQDLKAQFTGARAASSEVRAALGRMALYRWKNEAPIWGHGIISTKGPKVVEGMPIGSHHTWFGVLYTHGLVGCIAIVVPLVWSFFDLLVKAQNSQTAKAGLSVILVLILFTFAENIESLAYLYWPGLVIVGLGFKEPWWKNQET